MANRILVLDTTVLCCWLRIPGKDTAGPANDLWDFQRIDRLLKIERARGSTFVLPMATLIETGNHIAQCAGDRYQLAENLCVCLNSAALAESPWTAFSDQSSLWDIQGLQKLAQDWPALAATGMSIGDTTIKAVADYYAVAGLEVQILTGDQGLRAYHSAQPVQIPRRRRVH